MWTIMDSKGRRELLQLSRVLKTTRGLCLGHDQKVWHGAGQIQAGTEELGLGPQTLRDVCEVSPFAAVREGRVSKVFSSSF